MSLDIISRLRILVPGLTLTKLLKGSRWSSVFDSMYRDKRVITKIQSDHEVNYEASILRYLENVGCAWSPRVYLSIDVYEDAADEVRGWPVAKNLLPDSWCGEFNVTLPRELIVYDYIEGEVVSEFDYQMGVDIEREIHELEGYGIVHGDVGMRNILKRPDGRYTLIDFGCAAGVENTSTGLRFPSTTCRHPRVEDDLLWLEDPD